VLTVPWATRTRTGTGSFLEKKFRFDFLLLLLLTAAGQTLHTCERSEFFTSSIDVFLVAFDSVVRHKQHMIPCNV
jgi:hypothetical protein